jgi:hypothetical protein
LFFHDCTWDEEFTQQSHDLLSSIGTEMFEVGYKSLRITLNKGDSVPAQDIYHLRSRNAKKLKEIVDDPVNCRVLDISVNARRGKGVKEVYALEQQTHSFPSIQKHKLISGFK